MKVRLALPQDTQAVVKLMRDTHAESAFANEPYVEELVIAEVSRIAIERPEREVIFVCELDTGELIGYIKAYMSRYFFNYHSRAVHQVLHVTERYRGSRAAFLLLKAFAVWGAQRKAINICCAVALTEAAQVKRFDKLMKHLGFEQEGAFYRKAVTSVR